MWKIPLVEISSQNSSPPPVSMKQEKKIILLEKMEEMLKNKAITLTQNKPEKFVSSNFIIPNKSSGFRPAINLKNLNVQPLSTTISKWKVYFFMNELLEE